MNAACKDYDGKTYYQGKNAADEPACVTLPSEKTLGYTGHWGKMNWGMVDFIHCQKRSASSLGLDNVKVAYDETFDMTKEMQKRHDQACFRSYHGASRGLPPAPPAPPKPVYHGTIRRHYGGGR